MSELEQNLRTPSWFLEGQDAEYSYFFQFDIKHCGKGYLIAIVLVFITLIHGV